MMKVNSYLLPIVMLSTLSACGGGGGGSASTPPASINSTVEVNKPTPKSENTQTTENKPEENTKPQPPVAENKPAEDPKPQPPIAENKPTESPKPQPPIAENKPTESPEPQPPIVENKPTEKPLPPVEEKAVWSGDFPHSKDQVPVIYFVINDKISHKNDPNILERRKGYVKLEKGLNSDPEYHYEFYLLDDNAYYGYYRDTTDMTNVDSHFVYGYNETAENKGDLSQLTANYKGQFWYSTRGVFPNLVTPSTLTLTYENGVAKGEIISRLDDKLFDVSTSDNPRQLLLNPATEFLENSNTELRVSPDSPDRTIFNIHFIHGKDGTENKSLVGKGGNEKYWGVLGAEKQ